MNQSVAENSRWEAVIGLEVHCQLQTNTKMFCRCANQFGSPPNTNTCPVCVGHPGSLPVINETAIEYAIMAGLALGCDIAPYTKFDRKNYYYPDLPKAYQISQFDMPICENGGVEIRVGGEVRTIPLERIHIEEDAGKNIHAEGEPRSRVDLNRAGTPLLEIVSRPEIHTAEETVAYVKTLRMTMLYLGISDVNMEEGSLRCDCNVSIRPRGSDQLETRAEIKNLNSFTFIQSAVQVEIARQIQLREAGHVIVQETRLYDSERNETRSMRGKEEAHDYRYFPEPDLMPMTIDEARLAELRERVPALPEEALDRLVKEHALPDYDADILIQDPEVVGYFEDCVKLFPQAKKVSNWVINDLFQEMNEKKVSVREAGISPERLVELIQAVDKKLVSVNNGREVFKKMIGNDRTVKAIIDEMGVGMISDDSVIRTAVKEALDANPSVVEDLRGGKAQAQNFLVGQVMKATRGKANPGQVAQLIQELLG
jgi:aspartyl-tRNA(Asn)/glutamyl-tRNA(Gln) amidotransferase subunit B